jgi:methyl-accepting chemotaxis protein
MSGSRPHAPADGPDDIEQLRHQIDGTREELADTVEALAAKADVKARAKDKATRVRTHAGRRVRLTAHRIRRGVDPVSDKARQRRVQVGASAGAAAALLALVVWRKRT